MVVAMMISPSVVPTAIMVGAELRAVASELLAILLDLTSLVLDAFSAAVARGFVHLLGVFSQLGTVALDILIAQIRFKPTRTKTVKRTPRKELEAEGKAAPDERGGKAKPRPGRPRARLRAAPSVSPYGVGLGFDVRF